MKKLSEDRFLADLFTKDAVQANFMQRIVDAINSVAKGAGVAVSGDLPAPPPVNAITVKASGELVHATLTHNAEVSRAINYFVEADTSPSFTQPQVMSEGSRRTHAFHLPTFDDNGKPQQWYLRAYAQYPGSKPSTPTVLGGITNPTAVQLKGTTKMTLLPSTGSGTASSTGQQGGAGLGRQRVSTPKAVRIGKQQSSAAAVQPVQPVVQNSHLATGSTPQFATDASPFSFATTTTSVTFTWSAFNLYRNDGSITVIPPSPAGGIVISGLVANTLYRFYPYWDEIAQTVGFASGGVGSPSFAFTAAAPLAAQQQNLTTHVPLSAGALQVTTPNSGTGGGSGGGGGGSCFSPEVKIVSHSGLVPIGDIGPGDEVFTARGTWREVRTVLRHKFGEAYVCGLPDGTFVTTNHLLRDKDGQWKPASELIFKRVCVTAPFVVNLEIDTDEDASVALSPFTERSFALGCGYFAHNFKIA